MPAAREIAREQLLWLLGSLSAMFRVPFDATLVAQDCPPPCTLATLREAARSLGMRTTAHGARDVDWRRLPVPAIAFLRNAEASPSMPGSGLVLIVRADGDRLLYYRAGGGTPEILRAADAASALEPELLQVAVDAAADRGADATEPGFGAPDARFGFRWFLPELLKHRRIWRDVLLASLALQVVGLATPIFTQVIIDKVVVHQTQSTLVVVAVALAMFVLFTAIMTWLRQYLVLHTGNRIDAVLGSEVFRHLLRLPLSYFEQRPTGALVARLRGVETLREFVSGAAVALLLDLPFLLIFLAVMFAYSWQLSLIAVALLALIALVGVVVTPVFRARLDRQFLLGARSQSFLTEYVSGMGTVKSLQLEPDLDRKYGDLLAQCLAAGFSTRQAANAFNVTANALEQLMTLSILVVGALLVMRSDGFTIGMLVAFQMFAGRMSQPLLRLAGLWQEFQQANQAVRRLGDILDMPPEPHTLAPNREGAQPGQGGGRLDVDGIAFRYSGRRPWLYRQLDLRFPSGRLCVVTGPSGCGKSTLAKLLLGFYQPDEGRITLDGTDIRHLGANELRSAFGVVPQETVLFAGSLYDNLVMAHPHASFDDVIAACKAAEIHETIEQLPQGYQTEIGERGTGLSGGQRQRIAIARALLKRPRVLIFDEAVSNLDLPTAEQFARTINQLRGLATIVFITHQIPRGLHVDEVFTLGERHPLPRMEVVEDNEPREARWAT